MIHRKTNGPENAKWIQRRRWNYLSNYLDWPWLLWKIMEILKMNSISLKIWLSFPEYSYSKCFFEKQTILRIYNYSLSTLHIMKNLIFLNWKSLQESHRLTNLRHRCTDKGTKNKHMKEEKNAKMYVPIKRLQLKKNKYFAFKWCMGCK